MNDDTTDTATDQAAGPDHYAHIEAQAGAMEAAAVPPDPTAPAPGALADEGRETMELALSIVIPLMPDRYAQRYGPKEQSRIGDAFGALCEARGWSMADSLGRWAPELALVAALAGPALPVIMADIKARRAPPPVPTVRPANEAREAP